MHLSKISGGLLATLLWTQGVAGEANERDGFKHDEAPTTLRTSVITAAPIVERQATTTCDAACSSSAEASRASVVESIASTAGTVVPAAPSYAAFTPYSSGGCSSGTAVKNATGGPFLIQHSVDEATPYTYYDKPTFPGAESTAGGGYNVWFDIPDPDTNCNYLMLLPFQVQQYGDNVLAGAAAIIANKAGCYYVNVPIDSAIMTTYCCGTGDCTRVSLGDADLDTKKKREVVPPPPSTATDTSNKQSIPSSSVLAGESSSLAAFTATTTTQANASPTCSITNMTGPWVQAGPQVRVSNEQSCGAEASCSIAALGQISTSTTLTSSKDQTLSTATDVGLDIKAGEDIFVDFEVSASLSETFTSAWGKSTGTDVMNGTSQTITVTQGQAAGTFGFLSFIPVLQCWSGYPDCGAGPTEEPLTYCQVANSTTPGSGGGFVPQGTYQFVST